MAAVPLVRVVRSGLVESVHAGDVAVADGEGRLVAWAGDPDRPLFARSCMKPLQATVSFALAGLDLPHRELAVMCASHNAEPIHVETVRSLLSRAGVPESALRTPSVRPWDDESLAADPARRPINSDCSGKHAGMLAACLAQGWSLEEYRDPDHPLQRRVLEAVRAVTGLTEIPVGVDGCGVPVHGMPLLSVASIYAQLAWPTRWGDLEDSVRRATEAMAAEPYLVAGRKRVDTAVMRVAPGVLVKGGAEALMCAGLPDSGLGVAVKIDDGGSRATAPALIHALRSLRALDDRQMTEVEPFARPTVLGGGRGVGAIEAGFDLLTA